MKQRLQRNKNTIFSKIKKIQIAENLENRMEVIEYKDKL